MSSSRFLQMVYVTRRWAELNNLLLLFYCGKGVSPTYFVLLAWGREGLWFLSNE